MQPHGLVLEWERNFDPDIDPDSDSDPDRDGGHAVVE
jgi:hypothetical protein